MIFCQSSREPLKYGQIFAIGALIAIALVQDFIETPLFFYVFYYYENRNDYDRQMKCFKHTLLSLFLYRLFSFSPMNL